jgi:hypothetical protein
MPQLGIYHDDAVYLVTAKSLAEGNGYRIESLPEQPAQTKYPPLWPAVLATVWSAAPPYPGNLPWMALAAWIWIPACACLLFHLARGEGFGERESAGIAAFLAIQPAVAMAGTLLLSDLMSFALALASILLASRGRMLEGGVVAGLAYLARSAWLPLLPAALLAWRGGWRFGLVMGPFVVGWQWWMAANGSAPDPLTSFYTSYLGYWRDDVERIGLAAMAWGNLAALVEALGGKLATAAAVAGTVRLWRRGRMRPYAVFAALYSVELLLWNYPPNQRFAIPLIPMVAAGLWTEVANLAGLVRGAWRNGDRGSAAAVATALAAFAGMMVVTPAADFVALHRAYGEHARIAAENRPVREWLVRNTDASARVLSYSDPVVYLETGRRGYSLRVPPGTQLAGRRAMAEHFGALSDLLRQRNVGFALLSTADYHFDSQEVAWPLYRAALERWGTEQFRTQSGGLFRAARRPG